MIKATREQLIEWIRFKRGELSLQDVGSDTVVLMAGGLEVGDIVVFPDGQHVVKQKCA